MTGDLERVRGTVDWRPAASVPAPRQLGDIRTLRCWFDLGAAASVLCLAALPPHPGALAALALFVLGRILLVSWVMSDEQELA
jgi:hypothetical protein